MLEKLKRLPLLQAIGDDNWEMLAPFIRFRHLAADETLFDAGERGDALFVVIAGELDLYLPATPEHREVRVGMRRRGDTAGDFAVLNGGEHLVTARARNDVDVACFDRAGLDRLTDNLDTRILSHAYDTAAALSHRVLLIRAFLRLFGEIGDATLNELLQHTSIRHLRSGEELFCQGDEADGIYVVMAGRLPISIEHGDGSRYQFSEARAPQMVGEFSLITDSRRTATVYASRESMVAFIDRHTFDRYIMQRPQLLASVSRMIVERQRQSGRRRTGERAQMQIAVVPLHAGLPMRRFMHLLKAGMCESGSTLVLDSKRFDMLYGKSGAAQTRFNDHFNSSITAWLDDRDARYKQVVYVADPQWNAWTQRCLNRADRLLLLADASAPSAITPLETHITQMFRPRRHQPRLEYVFLHPADTRRPEGTRHWLRGRHYQAFHHVRADDTTHFARLARRLTGRGRGLVLSGGGARGYVHLGVQRALEEMSIDIDMIGGSSMGALLGGAIALGMNAAQIATLSVQFANPRALFDYTLPMASLMKSAKLTRFCHTLFGEARIEDLWTPFFCVSTNLSQGSEHLHTEGYLRDAVRASIAIPGIFTPVPQVNGELLVDGAVLNNFPADHMQSRLFGGTLIGVNVGQIEALENIYNYGDSLSGWQILGNRLNPFSPRAQVPTILETLLRVNDVKSLEELQRLRKMVDVLIEPKVTHFSLLDFRAYEQISEAGYLAATEVLGGTAIA
ncbi:cyclic nucleotide-binding and patatin-like phospholipase domain-containing protein [Granulosicoccaceae sp. 1_MG-2023]|nr:cyclic nucleotide-binding and patatin-like phospholipase domain-containing protein [Granulosicoccaceae sp. 1_MG-2023]